MSSVIDTVRGEPVLLSAVVSAALVVLVVLGVPVPDGLDAALAVLIVAVGALFARSKVTPVDQ